MLFNYFYFVNKYRNYVYRPFVVNDNSEFTNIYHSPLAVRHSIFRYLVKLIVCTKGQEKNYSLRKKRKLSRAVLEIYLRFECFVLTT